MHRVFCVIILLSSFQSFAQITTYTDLDQINDPLKVTHLSLRKKKLKSFPNEILSLKNLTHLDLGKNKIEKIPQNISELSHLKVIVLSKNRIEDFSALTQLTNLEEIHIDRNPVQEIPKAISNLENLLVFDCWQCQIESLPIEMKSLKKLIELDLRQTYIKQQDAGVYNEWWPNTKILTTWGCNCGNDFKKH